LDEKTVLGEENPFGESLYRISKTLKTMCFFKIVEKNGRLDPAEAFPKVKIAPDVGEAFCNMKLLLPMWEKLSVT
jgi:hypothetical protein